MQVDAIIKKIQSHIFPRRPRVKEYFLDYDPLHCGLISRPRFARSVHACGVCTLTPEEVDALADYYEREDGNIDYRTFVHHVDEVFGPTELEKTPMREVETAGASVPPAFIPNPVEDEVHLHAVMHRVALLAKTRGVVMKYCFHDFDRADSASLIVPRRSGKITVEAFKRIFPFTKEFNTDEIDLIIERYLTKEGTIHYQALHDAVSDQIVTKQEAIPRSDLIVRPDGLTWKNASVSIIDKLQAKAVEKRIRPRDYFKDFDPLRKGYVTVPKTRTVFSIMNIQISDAEFDQLCGLYCRPQDGMFHYDAFQERMDEAYTLHGLEHYPLARPPMISPDTTLVARKSCIGLTAAQEKQVEIILDKISVRVAELGMPLKQPFQDFDRVREGHVTMNQFSRIISTLDLALSPDEIELVGRKFCDKGNTTLVNYLDFIQIVDPIDPEFALAVKEQSSVYVGNTSNQYFDKSGKVIPVV